MLFLAELSSFFSWMKEHTHTLLEYKMLLHTLLLHAFLLHTLNNAKKNEIISFIPKLYGSSSYSQVYTYY